MESFRRLRDGEFIQIGLFMIDMIYKVYECIEVGQVEKHDAFFQAGQKTGLSHRIWMGIRIDKQRQISMPVKIINTFVDPRNIH
jgi:hypothetical protein